MKRPRKKTFTIIGYSVVDGEAVEKRVKAIDVERAVLYVADTYGRRNFELICVAAGIPKFQYVEADIKLFPFLEADTLVTEI